MVYTPSQPDGTFAPSLTLTLLLVACIVVVVFYGGLFTIFALWTSSARWRHDVQVFIGLVSDRLNRLLRAASQSVSALLSRRPRRPRLGDISPLNSMMTLLEVDTSTSSDRAPTAPRPDYASAFPLYTPPTTLPMPAITQEQTTTLTDDRPLSSQADEQSYEEKMGYLVYRPRAGYTPSVWPPSMNRKYRFILVSGVIVDTHKLIPSEVAVLPWYADN